LIYRWLYLINHVAYPISNIEKMLSFTQIYESYQAQASLLAFPAEPQKLYGSITYFMNNPGKKVRPVLCLMGNELFSEIQSDAYILANAVEVCNKIALIHDDIMDHSMLRRGRPTLHVKYGENTAILAGDMLLIHAYMQLNRIAIEYRGQVMSLFSDMAGKVCEGQQMDIDFEDREIETLSYAEYIKMITFKTSVLLGTSVRIGALIGGADRQQQNDIYQFGENIGIAFQIQDDFLDAFGHLSKTGKQVGLDILENKKTALLLKAFEMAGPLQKIQLKEAMTRKGEEKIEAVIALYKTLNIDQWASKAIFHYTEIAFESLDRIDIPVYKKEKVSELANSLLVRQS
jgi:geranylgeranyl diphosphate synthase type II